MPLTLVPLSTPDGPPPPPTRLRTGVYQFDRAFGGGITVPSTALIAGAPGSGKSTLLLQVAASLALNGPRVVYVTAEETADQLRSRAHRLALDHSPLMIAETTNVFEAIDLLSPAPKNPSPSLIIWDSVQRLRDPALRTQPGKPSQVQAVMSQIIDFSRAARLASIVVGHVNKASDFAGEMSTQHDPDATLFFDAADVYRLLSARKNRFGPTQPDPASRGLFQMTDCGLVPLTPTDQLADERAYRLMAA